MHEEHLRDVFSFVRLTKTRKKAEHCLLYVHSLHAVSYIVRDKQWAAVGTVVVTFCAVSAVTCANGILDHDS